MAIEMAIEIVIAGVAFELGAWETRCALAGSTG
jgi:hypothetical protein